MQWSKNRLNCNRYNLYILATTLFYKALAEYQHCSHRDAASATYSLKFKFSFILKPFFLIKYSLNPTNAYLVLLFTFFCVPIFRINVIIFYSSTMAYVYLLRIVYYTHLTSKILTKFTLSLTVRSWEDVCFFTTFPLGSHKKLEIRPVFKTSKNTVTKLKSH